MLNIPEEIKSLYKRDNLTNQTARRMEINFFDRKVEVLYPYETLFPDDRLYPMDLGTPWLTIKNDRIVAESFKLTESLCSDNDLVFGACEAAVVEFVCADLTDEIAGKEFLATIEIGGYVMSLGIYTVASVERMADKRLKKVVAYDKMVLFDTDVSIWYNNFFAGSGTHTLRELRDSLCAFIGVEQEIIDLVNDSMVVEKTIETNQLSGREILQAICEANGVFGHIERTGILKYISIKNSGLYPSETLYPDDQLYPSEPQEFVSVGHYRSAVYEEYLVNEIDRLEIREEDGQVGVHFGNGNNGYIIEGNMLLFGKSHEQLKQIASGIYDNISGRFYRPHQTTAVGLPYIEVGDGVLIATTDDVIESFVFSRTLSGIQAMVDQYTATGSEYREELFGINKEIMKLQGKTAVIKKQVDEVSVELKDFEQQTNAKFEITAAEISAEVKRAKEAEAKLSIKADKISASVVDLKNETEAQFVITAQQISTKVTKGTVSSEISQEPHKITLKANRLIVESEKFKLDGNGNAIFSGDITGANITGSQLRLGGGNYGQNGSIYMYDSKGEEIGRWNEDGFEIENGKIIGATITSDVFSADNDEVKFGDFSVTADGANILRSDSGWFEVKSREREAWYPGGDFAVLKIGGDGYAGVEITGTGVINCGGIKCSGIEVQGDIKFPGNSWAAGWTLLRMLEDLYDKIG